MVANPKRRALCAASSSDTATDEGNQISEKEREMNQYQKDSAEQRTQMVRDAETMLGWLDGFAQQLRRNYRNCDGWNLNRTMRMIWTIDTARDCAKHYLQGLRGERQDGEIFSEYELKRNKNGFEFDAEAMNILRDERRTELLMRYTDAELREADDETT